MKRRSIKIAVVLFAGVACAAILLFRRNPHDLSQGGKRLSTWLEQIDTPSWKLSGSAERALDELGTNAVPYLIDLLRLRDSRLKQRILRGAAERKICGIRFKSAHYFHQRALTACDYLGPLAKQVIPEWMELLRREDSLCVTFSFNSISKFGPEAVTQLAQFLARTESLWVRRMAANLLARSGFGSNVRLCLPQLLRASADSDAVARAQVLIALSLVDREIDTVTTTLIEHLEKDPDPAVRHAAVLGLTRIGPGIRRAIPALSKATLDADPLVARSSEALLRSLDRDWLGTNAATLRTVELPKHIYRTRQASN